MPFRVILSRAVRAMDLPFGYTLTIWSSGAIAIDHFGRPSILDILLFIFGAVCAYFVCALLSFRQPNVHTDVQPVGFTLINVFSIVAAAVVSIVAGLPDNPAIGYPIAGFVGTLTYVLSLSCMTWWVEGRQRTRSDKQS